MATQTVTLATGIPMVIQSPSILFSPVHQQQTQQLHQQQPWQQVGGLRTYPGLPL